MKQVSLDLYKKKIKFDVEQSRKNGKNDEEIFREMKLSEQPKKKFDQELAIVDILENDKVAILIESKL